MNRLNPFHTRQARRVAAGFNLTPRPAPAIRLCRVRHNNLKNFDLDLPLHRLIVITELERW